MKGSTDGSSTRGNTFRPIELNSQELAKLQFTEFVKALLDKLTAIKEERFQFYECLRVRNAEWTNLARMLLTWLGAIAVFLTSLIAVFRLAPTTLSLALGTEIDKPILLCVLVIYAIMGAISFYEKGSDKTAAYFRHISIILTIRDLWTKLQFALVKELTTLGDPKDAKAELETRARILALGEAFCVDLDKTAAGELSDFRAEFLTSLGELDVASKKGLDDITKQLEERAKSFEKAAAEARAAEKAADEAKKPGFVNLTLLGNFTDEVTVSVSNRESVRRRSKTVALEKITPGPTKIAATANKDGSVLEGEVIIDVKPGVQEARLTLN